MQVERSAAAPRRTSAAKPAAFTGLRPELGQLVRTSVPVDAVKDAAKDPQIVADWLPLTEA